MAQLRNMPQISLPNIYATMSDDGKFRQVIESILDHRTDQDALPKSIKYIISKTGKRRMRKPP